TVLLAFVLGTFDQIDLSRNERGKVKLSKTWRVCFRIWSTVVIPWRDYEGVASGRAKSADVWDWLTCITLLILAGIPGMIWWYLAIYPDTFFIALCKDHGYPELTLYRGKDEYKAQEIAATVREVTGLPLE